MIAIWDEQKSPVGVDVVGEIMVRGHSVMHGYYNRGIVLGATGQGEAMVANRRRGIRAAVVYAYNEEIVKMSREHNAANVLSLGASFLSEEEAQKAIKLWLDTGFSDDERHIRRIGKIDPQ